MKVKYKNFEIESTRQKAMSGYDMVYISAYRIDDGWEYICDVRDGCVSAREMIEELKESVDNYIKLQNDYIAEDDGYGIVGYSYKCKSCDELNRFVSEEDDEHYCEKCDSPNYFKPITY